MIKLIVIRLIVIKVSEKTVKAPAVKGSLSTFARKKTCICLERFCPQQFTDDLINMLSTCPQVTGPQVTYYLMLQCNITGEGPNRGEKSHSLNIC